MTTYADHHKIYLGIWQSQTLTYVIAPNNPSNNYIMPITDPNAGAFQTSTNDWYLETDPAKNTSMLDLNGMAVSPDTARYGIMDGSLDLGGQQRLTTSTAIKGKHGEDFGDYHFTNREIKFQLRVNCRDASNNVNIDIGLAAIQKISAYINNAYQSHIYRTHRTGQAPTPGQPIVLAVMLAGSTRWVYFDIIGGFVSTKTTFDTIDWSTGQITIEVTLVARYSAKGDFVWLSNAVIDGNFTGYSRGWSGSYTTHDDTSATTLTMGNLVPTYATVGNGATITSQTRVVTQGSKAIFSMYYQCTDTTTVITATVYTRKMMLNGSNQPINSVSPYNASTNPSGYVDTQIKSFTLPNNFSGTYTSTPFYIFDGQSGPGYNVGFTNVYVVLSFSSMTAASVALNQVALWTWPPFVQNPVAPTEYLNVIPDPRFNQGTKVYNVRGDIEAESLITVEPSSYSGDTRGNNFSTVRVGLRQVKGKPIPVFHNYGTNTTYGSTNPYASLAISSGQPAGFTALANNSFYNDRTPRTYKLYLLCQTIDVFSVKLAINKSSGTFLASGSNTITVLPSSTYPYLPNTSNSYHEYLVDLGVLTIPSGSLTASPASLNYDTTIPFYINITLNWLANYTGSTTTNALVYGLIMMPADQFFYCERASAVATNPIWIDSLSGVVRCTSSDSGGVLDVSDTQPQFTTAALRLYPSNGNWRTASSSVSGKSWPVSLEDSMPTEIVTLPGSGAFDPYDTFNGTVNYSTAIPRAYDNLVSVGYYPRYIDFSSTSN